jgi:hypothetical protein
MATKKPTLYFFKMPWCYHCVTFDEGRPAENGKPATRAEWPAMLNDPELNQLVSVKKVVWNGSADRGPLIAKPPGYEFVNYGPYFFLEAGKDEAGKPLGVTFRGDDRTAAGLKAWVKTTIATDPAFAQAKAAAKKERITVPAALNHPAMSKPTVQARAGQPAVQQRKTTTKKESASRKAAGSSSGGRHSSRSRSRSSGRKSSTKRSTSSSRRAAKAASKAVAAPSTGQDRRLRAMKPAVIEQNSGDILEEEEEPTRGRASKVRPSPHDAPGGAPTFSYNRPGTQVRRAFNAPAGALDL